MSGIKPIEQTQFYDRIRERGLTVEMIAAAVGRSRCTVTKVLNGATRRGPLWRRIERLLLPAEIALLDVAHCSPWNTRRIAKRPVWNAQKAQALHG